MNVELNGNVGEVARRSRRGRRVRIREVVDGGVRTKCTREVIDEICGAIKIGAHLETACAFAGVTSASLRKWIQWGKEGKAKRYVDFYKETKKAIAIAQIRDLATIDSFSNGVPVKSVVTRTYPDKNGVMVEERTVSEGVQRSWQASAWRLERRNPKRWGKQDKHMLAGADGGPLRIQFLSVPVWGDAEVIEEKTPVLDVREIRGLGPGENDEHEEEEQTDAGNA